MAKTYELAFEMNAALKSKFGRSFDQANDKIAKMERGFQELEKRGGTASKALSADLGKIEKSANGAASAIANITAGGGLLAGAAAIGGAGASIYTITSTAAESMAQLEASTGATSVQMNELRLISKGLFKDGMGEDLSDLTQSLATASQVTKLQGDALKQTTKYAMAYRDVFGEDIPESIKASDTMMKNFNISSDAAFNLLAQGAQKGLNKSQELLDSANEYAPHFASLGFTANQMFDTFSAGLENGAFNLDKVGDAIKEFNIRSKDMSKTSTQAYEALGLNAAEMSRTFAEGGPEAQIAFKKIVKAISSVKDPVKKNTIGVELFGTQFEDLEKDVIKAMGEARNQYQMTAKTMDKLIDAKYDTPQRAWQRIGRTVQTELLLPIGEKLLPYMNDFSESVQTFADKYAPKIASSVTGAIDKVNEYINKNFINNPDFMELDTFGEKASFMFDMIETTYDSWWASSGKTAFEGVAGNIISTIGSAMESNAHMFIEAGKKIGSTLGSSIWDELEKSEVGWLIKAASKTRDVMTPAWMESLWAGDPGGAAKSFFIPGWGGKPGDKSEGFNPPMINTPEVQSLLNSIPGRAKGGYISRPELSWIGEGKDNEWVIPENRSKRSRAMWTEAGSNMGLLPAGGGSGAVFNFNIAVNGGGPNVADQVKGAVAQAGKDFERQFNSLIAQRQRTSFG